MAFNKIWNWVKAHKFITVLVIILLTPFVVIYKPYKVTDPSNPLFVEAWFRVTDYRPFHEDDLKDALRDLFPVGTPKAYVDKMLVDRAGMSVGYAGPGYVSKGTIPYYKYSLEVVQYTLIPYRIIPRSYTVRVRYDNTDKVIAVDCYGDVVGKWISKNVSTSGVANDR
jgi:hypothetical protein